jgi:GTPase SAR1 family protein
MAANPAKTLRIGVYGPASSGKSLLILRWCNPALSMNEDDLTGNPFINLYRTSSFDSAGVELIEHPSDDKLDPTEDRFIIVANLIGWRDIYEQATKANANNTVLVFTWKDRPSSGALSSKIHEKHEECSSYSGVGFEQFKSLVLRKAGGGNINRKKKKRTITDDDGWSKK